MSRLTRDGTAEPVSRDQILRHARGQGNIIFPVQLTTSRIGNLTRLIHTLLYVMTIHTYIHILNIFYLAAPPQEKAEKVLHGTRKIVRQFKPCYRFVTVAARKVCTLSTQFETGSKLRAQLLRWSRNSWRSDIKMLFLERSVWRKYPWLAITSVDKMISPFTMVYGPIAIVLLSFMEQNMFILIAFMAYILVTRIVKTIMYFTWSRPRPPVNWFLYIGPFIIVQYWGAVIKLFALCTLKDRRWGNREVKVNSQNEVVRTGEFEDKEGGDDVGPFGDETPPEGEGDYDSDFEDEQEEGKAPENGVEMGRVSHGRRS